jgi:hypothetical protein
MNATMVRSLTAASMLMGLVAAASAAEKAPYSARGLFVEGCSCAPPCTCELFALEADCNGVGAMELTGGEFNGVKLAGARLAYAGAPGKWISLYVDSPDDKQREAALAFAKAYYREWGKLKTAKPATIKIKGQDGHFTVTVDDGKIMTLKTEPILGGDGKTPIQIFNTKSGLNSTVSQARTISCEFKDGDQAFELKDSNSYFNSQMNARGSI